MKILRHGLLTERCVFSRPSRVRPTRLIYFQQTEPIDLFCSGWERKMHATDPAHLLCIYFIAVIIYAKKY
jgi:hypothetical protein